MEGATDDVAEGYATAEEQEVGDKVAAGVDAVPVAVAVDSSSAIGSGSGRLSNSFLNTFTTQMGLKGAAGATTTTAAATATSGCGNGTTGNNLTKAQAVTTFPVRQYLDNEALR